MGVLRIMLTAITIVIALLFVHAGNNDSRATAEYAPLDGKGNNVHHEQWGTSEHAIEHYSNVADFDDARARSRPSPRAVSNEIFSSVFRFSSRQVSDIMSAFFGQFWRTIS